MFELVVVAAVQISFLLAGAAVVYFSGVDVSIRKISIEDDVLIIGFTTVCSLFLLVGSSVVRSFFGLSPGSVAAFDRRYEFMVEWFVLSAFVAALAEEFLFRGAIQGTLRRRFGPLVSITVASSVFGFAHILNYTGTPLEVASAVISISLVSIPFAIAYETTDNIVVPIASHGLYNAILILTVLSTI